MKRIIAILVTAAMLLSLGVIVASAEDERVFTKAGEVEIAWLTEDQVAQIEFDGKIDEWNGFDLDYKTLNWNNMVTWQCRDYENDADNVTAVDWYEWIGPDFAINAYFAADADYLYVAFYIDDEHFARSNNSTGDYNGDAFQISVDWNRHMENALESGVDYENNKNVFYSFSCGPEDGEELAIRVQEGFQDRTISQSTSVDPEHPDVKGSAGEYETGWCAEFALSWELLYKDFEYKTWESPVDNFDANTPITIGLGICYLNRAETNGNIEWAAGTFVDNTKMTKWEPLDNGLYAVLNWAEGREINCTGIKTGDGNDGGDETTGVDETAVDETEVVTTKAADTEVADTEAADTEAVTTKAADTEVADTEAADTEAATTAADKETDASKPEETTAPAEAGCKSVIASASVLAVVALAAGAVICKKKD